jgi:hypothetical protein
MVAGIRNKEQVICEQCGAPLGEPAVTCDERFATLLALDHSRQEPWGSRHGLAFAAYTLQHGAGQPAHVLERCWLMLCRVHVAGDEPMRVARGLRAHGGRAPQDWAAPPFPKRAALPSAFGTTIVDLGEFAPDDYATRLDAWCRATLIGWGLESLSA